MYLRSCYSVRYCDTLEHYIGAFQLSGSGEHPDGLTSKDVGWVAIFVVVLVNSNHIEWRLYMRAYRSALNNAELENVIRSVRTFDTRIQGGQGSSMPTKPRSQRRVFSQPLLWHCDITAIASIPEIAASGTLSTPSPLGYLVRWTLTTFPFLTPLIITISLHSTVPAHFLAK